MKIERYGQGEVVQPFDERPERFILCLKGAFELLMPDSEALKQFKLLNAELLRYEAIMRGYEKASDNLH